MAVSLSLVAEAAAGPAQPEDAREKAEKEIAWRERSLFLVHRKFSANFRKKGKREKARNILVGSIVLAQASSCGRCREEGVVI
mgnify:CR=1 FL=1